MTAGYPDEGPLGLWVSYNHPGIRDLLSDDRRDAVYDFRSTHPNLGTRAQWTYTVQYTVQFYYCVLC